MEPNETIDKLLAQQRIIIVEDDDDFRESIVETLQLQGLNITGTNSALEFYRMIAQDNYRLVILDLGLPDQDGIVLAEYIRSNTDMRIIVLTARSATDSRIEAYRAGADAYLLKPIDTRELVASIRSTLGRLTDADSPRPQEHHAEPVPGGKSWVLSSGEQSLTAPNGQKVKLSSKEFDFLEVLARQEEGVVDRQQLLAELSYDHGKPGSCALDVLMHRIRQKTMEIKQRLPIRTIRGRGYSLSAPIETA